LCEGERSKVDNCVREANNSIDLFSSSREEPTKVDFVSIYVLMFPIAREE